MDLGGFSWGLQTIIGGALFVIVVAWAVLRNRTSRQQDERTEQATHDLYAAEDRAARNDGDGDRVP